MEVLKAMNFDLKWISWIHAILSTTRISVLVNGSPAKEFSPSRGLRQGDPISPLLYNLVGKALHSMFNTAADEGVLKGLLLGKRSKQITHLQYADDTVIFIDNNTDSIEGVKSVL